MDVLEPRLMLSGSPWEVSLAADDRYASEQDTDPAVIVVTRTGTGDIAQALTVNYTVAGTAEATDDYQALTGTVDILAGQASASIAVVPTDDGTPEFPETLTLTLSPDAGYDILAGAQAAEITIADDDDGVAPAADGFAVNTTTSNEQKLWQVTGSELAALPGGGFVSVWNSIGQDGSYWGVYGQIFDAAGAKVGSEFQVNTHTTLSQYHASVASDADGNVVVIWTSTGGQDGNLAGIFARRFDSQGNPLSGEFQINTTTTGTQEMPEVSFLSDGRFSSLPGGKGEKVSYSCNTDGELESVTNALEETVEYRYEAAQDHYLTAVVDPRGFDAMTVAYDPDSGKVLQVRDINDKGANAEYQDYEGLRGTTTYTDALGNITEVEYDHHGNPIRTIREVHDSSGTPVKYVVTVQTYDYVSDYGVDPLNYGSGLIPYGTSYLNQLSEVSEYQSFEVAAPDTDNKRHTTDIDELTLSAKVVLNVGAGQEDPDVGRIQSATILASNGATEMTTQYSQYQMGTPGSVTDPYGGTMLLDCDDAGNITWRHNAAGEETYYSYTTGEDYAYADGSAGLYTSLAKGLLLETWRFDSQSVKVVLQKNVYGGDEASPWYRGKVKETTDAAGLTTRYAYYQDGQARKVLRQWQDTSAQNHSVLDGETYYDELGRPSRVVGSHGEQTSIFYDAMGQTTAIEDMFGGYTVHTYDARGNLIRTLSPDGVEARSVYDDVGRVTWSGDAFACGSQCTFDEESGEVTWQANDNAATYVVMHYVYDSLGRVTQTETFRDVTIEITPSSQFAGTFVSDIASQPTSGQLLYDTETVYDPAGRAAASKDMDGVWTGGIYYANGQIRYSGPMTSAAAGTVPDDVSDLEHYWEYKYDQDDNGERYDEQIDPLGNATRTYRDETNRVVCTLYADGSRMQSIYGGFAEIVADQELTLPGGFPATISGWMDVEFAPRQAAEPAVATIRIYDDAGRLTDFWLPPVVDASNPGDPVSPHWQYTYDANGARLSQTDPDGNTTAFAYDEFVRRISRTLPDTLAESFVYASVQLADIPTNDLARSVSAGQLAYVADFEGRVTAYLYDNTAPGGGRLVEKQYFATVTDYLNSSGTAAEYVTYDYDAMGRNTDVRQHRAGGPIDLTRYIYDDLGQLVRVENPRGAVNYEYDSSWRLVRTYTGNAEPTYGQRTGSSDDGIAVTDTSYQYNSMGKFWKTELHAHDDQALVAPEATTYHYDAAGGIQLVMLPNGVTCEYTYDELGQMDLLTHYAPEEGGGDPNDYSDNRVIAGFDYGYDSRGRLTSVLEQFDTDDQTGFELVQSFGWAYDDLDRVTAETFDLGDDGSTTGDYVTMYTFDLNDNRCSKETQHDYSGPVGQMTADETVSYVYDGNGRLLQETLDADGTADDRTTVYHYGTSTDRTEQTGRTVHEGLTGSGAVLEDVTRDYDLAGRQVSVEVDKTGSGGGVEITTFTYDDDGNRVTQTAGTGSAALTTTYLIDGNNFTGYSQTLEQTERDSSGTIVKNTTYVVDTNVTGQYVTTTGGTQGAIFLADGRGSTRALYDAVSADLLDAAQVSAGGAWTKILSYDAYGNALGFDPATAITEMLYNGESFNARTGQQYLRARWYNPSAGRFGSMDPYAGSIYSPHTLNGYGYCQGDSINYVDPSGSLRQMLSMAGSLYNLVSYKATLFLMTYGSAIYTAGGHFKIIGGAYYLMGTLIEGLERSGLIGPTNWDDNFKGAGLILLLGGHAMQHVSAPFRNGPGNNGTKCFVAGTPVWLPAGVASTDAAAGTDPGFSKHYRWAVVLGAIALAALGQEARERKLKDRKRLEIARAAGLPVDENDLLVLGENVVPAQA